MTDNLLIAAISMLFTFLLLGLGLLFYTAIADTVSTYGLSGVAVTILAVTIFSIVYRKIKQEWES